MTAREFQIEFEREASYIDKIKDGSVRINSEDVNLYGNKALHIIINNKLKSSRNEDRNGIKVSQRELDEIRQLIVKNTTLVVDSSLTTSEYTVYTLPSDYYFLIADKSNTGHCNVNKTYQNRLYSSEKIYEILEDTHYKTKYNSPVSELVSNKLYVYKTSNFTLNSVYIDYIKQYTEIDVIGGTMTDISDTIHKDIVSLAVSLLMENIQSGRFQTTVEKNAIIERIN